MRPALGRAKRCILADHAGCAYLLVVATIEWGIRAVAQYDTFGAPEPINSA